ncbi:MAG: dihydrodipicolinate synthase family protein [Chloroflexi bacterium]|nr:dihydrodipicolinate synthase family protein [Chloroflexota bacterium]
MTNFTRALEGVIAFPVTPFDAADRLDESGLRTNVVALLDHPMAAVVAAGGTGELYSLSEDEHRAVVSTTIAAVAGRVPVIAGVGGSLGGAMAMARHAHAEGVDAILALPPWYPGADRDGLLAYYQSIGGSTPLPLIVYSRDWVNPLPGFVEDLASSVPTLVAWKDGQGDIRRYQHIMARLGDRLHWIGGAGDDLVGAYYQLGIRCYTSSIANVAPALSLRLHEVAAREDAPALRDLLAAHVTPLYAFRGRRKGYEVSAMKALMTLQGRAAGPVRAPLVEVSPGELEELRQILQGWAPFL